MAFLTKQDFDRYVSSSLGYSVDNGEYLYEKYNADGYLDTYIDFGRVGDYGDLVVYLNKVQYDDENIPNGSVVIDKVSGVKWNDTTRFRVASIAAKWGFDLH